MRFERFGDAARETALATTTVAAPATIPPAAAIATVRASSREGNDLGRTRGRRKRALVLELLSLLDRLSLQHLLSHLNHYRRAGGGARESLLILGYSTADVTTDGTQIDNRGAG